MEPDPGGQNLIALDYGRRRVGVAACSAGVPIAFGIDTLQISGIEDLLEQIQRILKDRKVDAILIGLPMTLSDQPGTLTEEILNLARRLEERGYPVLLVDEALSSRRADGLLRRRGRRLKKQDRDRASAALILQDYLDGRLPPLTRMQFSSLEKRDSH